MGNTVVKGGTPVGSASLCRTCSNAVIMTGYRESEQVTLCQRVDPTMVVPFVIYECSGYYDKNRPTWKQMHELALDIVPRTLRPVGFKTSVGFTQSVHLVRPERHEEDDD